MDLSGNNGGECEKNNSTFWRCQEVKSGGIGEGLGVGDDGENIVDSRVSLTFCIANWKKDPEVTRDQAVEESR